MEANVQMILTFTNKMPESCYCHPMACHKFLNCSLVQDICKQCNKEGIINQAISHVNSMTTGRTNPTGGDGSKKQKRIENAQAKRIQALEVKLTNLDATMMQVAIAPNLTQFRTWWK